MSKRACCKVSASLVSVPARCNPDVFDACSWVQIEHAVVLANYPQNALQQVSKQPITTLFLAKHFAAAATTIAAATAPAAAGSAAAAAAAVVVVVGVVAANRHHLATTTLLKSRLPLGDASQSARPEGCCAAGCCSSTASTLDSMSRAMSGSIPAGKQRQP
jgi:hypothetical protein